MRKLALSKVYRLIEPGPVVLLVTARRGTAGVMTMSWHMMMDFEPPLVGCVVSSANHSFAALQETGECVIAIPPANMAQTVVGIGNCSGRDVDKFDKFKLSTVPAGKVAPPLIEGCIANLECKVKDASMVQRHSLFVLEVIEAWSDTRQKTAKTLHHHGYGKFVVDGETIRIRSRMP
jgi:flavin reductase (DIM6/NTAB) family NADH-FMN oxidoreductase RutF